jgi:hypothetical protein
MSGSGNKGQPFDSNDEHEDAILGSEEQALIDLRLALLNVAESEGKVLKSMLKEIEDMLGKLYATNNELIHTMTAQPLLGHSEEFIVDPEVITDALNDIHIDLSKKNEKIKKNREKLQRTLALLYGEKTPVKMAQTTYRSITQMVQDLTDRNEKLLTIQKELQKHAVIIGQLPKGVNPKEIEKMLVSISRQTEALYNINSTLKEQIREQKLSANKPEPPPARPGPGRSRL